MLSSAIFADYIRRRNLTPILASIVWERFVKDPLPGPRRLDELKHLTYAGEHLAKASRSTAFPNGTSINQAVLVGSLGLEDNYILDPHYGVAGLIQALKSLNRLFPVTEAWGIDVGGDVLAERSSSHLRSPLADAMLLAALVDVFPDAKVAIFGIGVDGELPRHVWEPNIARHLSEGWIIDTVGLPANGIDKMSKLLDARLVDTEASAMVIRAYQGLHGRYLVRDAGSVVSVDVTTLLGFVYKAAYICESINELPDKVQSTNSIQEASEIIERCGYNSEWRYEHEKVSKLTGPYSALSQDELQPLVSELLDEISSRKPAVHFTAERYLAERLKVDVSCVRVLLENLQKQNALTLHPPFFKLIKR